MPYELSIEDAPLSGDRAVGENVLFNDLTQDYRVYLFSYAGSAPLLDLEARLRALGETAGKNLFVNIGRLNDPSHDRIAKRFEVKRYPVLIMTAVASLASPPGEYMTAYVRLDHKSLLASPDRAMDCIEKLFPLFLRGDIAKAVSTAKWSQHAEALIALKGLFVDALDVAQDFLETHDISGSFIKGEFAIKKTGS